MSQRIERNFFRPTIVPLLATAITLGLIVLIGELLLALFEHGKPELERLELWVATFGAIALIGTGAFLATRKGSLGPLDEPVAVGDRAMFEPPLPPVDVQARNGPLGSVADIQPGFALYAQSGQLARVIGMLPGGEEYGQRYRGYIYAEGVFGATEELWIPVEAVVAVYPETQSVFLGIKGDETETYGWNRPPASFRRTPREPEPPKAL